MRQKVSGTNKKHWGENCQSALNYANSVISGDIVACVAMVQVCKRFKEDLEFSKKPQCSFFFDAKRAESYCAKAQYFEHPSGKWKTKNIHLEDWQRFFYINIFGWYRKKTNTRRFKTALLFVGRGNAKTTQAAQIGLLHLAVLEDANGNFVYTAATKKEQARLCFENACTMVEKNSEFANHFHVKAFKEVIRCDKTFSKFKPLSSKSSSLDGLNAVLVIIDELHEIKRELFNVISTGMRKRADSLLLLITTAGEDITGPGFAEYTYAKKVISREINDDSYFAMIYEIDKEDDAKDSNVWIKANPNLGISIDKDIIHNAVQKSLHSQAEFAGVKVKHMNVWNQEASQYYQMNDWDACADTALRIEDFKGERCYIGWDLASVSDLTALAVIFKKENIFYVFEKCYLPEEGLKKQTNDLYQRSAEVGELTITPGKTFNTNFIKEDLLKIASDYEVVNSYYDEWNALDLVRDLNTEGFPTEVFHKVAKTYTGPMKKILACTIDRKLRHNGSHLFRWCVSNVEAKVDHNDNVFPRKKCEDARFKIDPAVAMIMGLRGWIVEEEKKSVYEERDIIVL